MGIQGNPAKPSNYLAVFSAETTCSEKMVKITAVLVDNITHNLPAHPIYGTEDWEVTCNLCLADPSFHKPGHIDALIGMDVLSDVLLNGLHTGKPTEPKAFNTVFGWAVAGQYQGSPVQAPTSLHVVCEAGEDLTSLLKRFLESVETSSKAVSLFTLEEQVAVGTFQQTVKRTTEGRYQVNLPRKPDSASLGNSRDQALKRFHITESSLLKKGTWPAFSNAVQDYFIKDHAELVRRQENQLQNGKDSIYYLPMHAVLKPSSTTTKIWVVFDASARSTSGLSLNDVLLSGPNVHPHIPDQLLKFRRFTIGMAADISKMFRQILLDGKDRDLHRFVFRASPDEPVQDYRMKRLTFGVTSSPFVATETLRQVAKDFDVEFAVALEIVLKDFYVDDLLIGTNNLDEAIILRSQLNVLLERGGFLLRKWHSNSKDLLATIPEKLKEKEPVTELKFPRDFLKALGVHWDTDQDTLHVSTPNIQLCSELTKRKLVSDVAKTYDVLGWFAPALSLQRTWEARISWDDPVPREILIDWQRWAKELPMLTRRPLQRYYMESSKEADAIQFTGSEMLQKRVTLL